MNRNLTTILTVLVLILTTSFAFAGVSVTDIKGSSITKEQKLELYQLIKDGQSADAESKFEIYLADAELATVAAEVQVELEKEWTAQVRPDSMTYDKCVDQWCDSTDKAIFLAKRWNFDELDSTLGLDAMKVILHNGIDAKANERQLARVASLEAQLKARKAKDAEQDEAIAGLTTQVNSNTGRLDIVEQRLTDNEFDMAAALRELAKQAKVKDDKARETLRNLADDIVDTTPKSK